MLIAGRIYQNNQRTFMAYSTSFLEKKYIASGTYVNRGDVFFILEAAKHIEEVWIEFKIIYKDQILYLFCGLPDLKGIKEVG